MTRLHVRTVPSALVLSLLPVLSSPLVACSHEPYLLDAEAIRALDGGLPDSDPWLLDARDEPGQELAEPTAADEVVLDRHAPLVSDEVDLLPMSADEVRATAQALQFPGSTLTLESKPEGWPQRTTVQLTITWAKGEEPYACTGTLIRPDAVLTAAHCLYNAKRGGFAYSIVVTPGMQAGSRPFDRVWARRSLVPSRYRELDPSPAKEPFDYGVLRLKSGFAVGTRRLAVGSSALDRAFTVRGYPGDGSERFDGMHMYVSHDRVRSIRTDGLFFHRASTEGGMSGAGIDDGTNILGVHVAGAPDYNEGVVFSPTSKQQVEDFATRAL